MSRIPRLYAAASLKQRTAVEQHAAIICIPRLYAAASLKQRKHVARIRALDAVFRGFMPRPH